MILGRPLTIYVLNIIHFSWIFFTMCSHEFKFMHLHVLLSMAAAVKLEILIMLYVWIIHYQLLYTQNDNSLLVNDFNVNDKAQIQQNVVLCSNL